MTSLANILADGEDIGGLLQLLALAAVVIIAGAAKWLGSKLEKKQAEQQAAEQARRQQEAQEEAHSRPPRQQAPQARQAQRKTFRATAPPPIVLEPAEQRGLVEAEVTMQSGSKDETYDWATHKTMPAAALLTSVGKVDLSNPDTLRQAFIYHELLSPPKALRQEREQWDI